jgi:hypothetical protein
VTTLNDTFARLPKISFILAVLLAAAVLFFVYWGSLSYSPTGPVKVTPFGEPIGIVACMQNHMQILGPAKIDASILNQLQEMCFRQLDAQGRAIDFQLRRLAFLQQDYAEHVILWMVVVITISGVLFAGLQVLASYKLASAGRGDFAQAGEITLEKYKISLKSSITGLFILVISFAFFSLFVIEVYRIKEVSVDPKPSATGALSGVARLQPGGIGPSPTKPATKSATPPSAGEPRPSSAPAQPNGKTSE